MAQRQAQTEASLADAIVPLLPEESEKNASPTETTEKAGNKSQNGINYTDLPDKSTQNDQSAEENLTENRDYKRDSNGRFAETGASAHSHKGGRSSKGKKKTSQKERKLQKQVDAVEKAIKTTAKKGSKTTTVHGKEIKIETGHPNYFGTRHAALHFTPKQINERKAAKAIVLGEAEKHKDGVLRTYKTTKAITKKGKNGKDRWITAYKDTKNPRTGSGVQDG